MSREVTLRDVAAKADVSYQTVSKVLNNKGDFSPDTKARIWAAIEELNYRPNISARNLRTLSSNLIGYGWRQADSVAPHPVLDAFLYSTVYNFEKAGYHLLTFLVADSEDTGIYQSLFHQRQVEGFIMADTNDNDPRIAHMIKNNIPFVSFGRANDQWDFCWVDVDGICGLEKATTHLIKQGHQRIALFTWPIGSKVGSHREMGYFQALNQSGISADSSWLVRGKNTVRAGVEGFNHLRSLPASRRPTAVVCVSDLIAIGVMNGAAAVNLEVGQDIAITGYDDTPMAEYLHPPLTSVRQPIPEVGQHVVNLLLKQINGDEIAEKGILLSPELIVRASSQTTLSG
jgi:DNA-binding LacI/PurR family transcriptional regulator